MKYVLTILLLLLMPLIFSGCGDIQLQSFWIKTDVKIDGRTVDWREVPIHAFEKYSATLGVCNDKDNLYLLFRFTNPEWLRVASSRGFTVWADPSGEKIKKLGLCYICLPPFEQEETLKETVVEEDYWGGWQPTRHLNNGITEKLLLLRSSDKPGREIRADGLDGPQVKLGHASGVFIYELALPLKLLKPQPNVTDTLPHPPYELKIGLNFGGMDAASLKQHKRQIENSHASSIDTDPIGEIGQGGAIGNRGGKSKHGGSSGRIRSSQGGITGIYDDREEVWVTVILADRPVVRLK